MRRLATLDRVLLGTLLPLWLTVFVLHVRQVVVTGLAEPPVYAFAAHEPNGPPVVAAFRPELHGAPGLAIGDRLLRVGPTDLHGAGYLEFYAATLAATDDHLEAPVEYERNGERHSIMLAMRRPAIAWYWIPALLGTAVTAVLVLLRAPDVQQARLFFLAIMVFITFCTPFHGRSYTLAYLSRGVFWYGLGGIGFALVWLWVINFPGEVARDRRLSPVWALLAGAVWYTSRINYVTPGFPAAVVPTLKGTCDAFLMAGGLWIATRNYRLADPIGRRRVKWLLYGAYIAVVPLIVARTLTIADPDVGWYENVYVATVIGMVGFPLGTLIAIVRYNLFDIDRLISATAAYSLALVAVLGALLALAPPLARAASQAMGMDRVAAQVLTALGLASFIVPLGGRLRVLIERIFFSERHAFERGMQRVLDELTRCDAPDEVTALVAQRVGELLRPERLVLYARTGDGFAPAIVQGSVAAARLETLHPLVEWIARHPTPVVVPELRARGNGAQRGREALDALGACLAVRVHRGGDMAAFVCLGRKHSGDVYTSTDTTILAAVADKASSELLRFRHTEIIEQARQRADALRRAKEDADRSNLAKSRFLAAASHDLRQPLHALGLFASALRDRVRDADARDLVDKIARSTDALEAMFDALLDISRLDAGVLQPVPADVALQPLLERLAAEFGPIAAEKGLRLRVRATRLAVRSDVVMLSRIVQNLIANAVRYTERGGVLVGCRRRGDEVRIDVVDTGRGIPPDQQATVFEEFRRLGTAPADTPGLGLGLSIVDRLARLLGHRVTLRSTPGRGSVFTVTAPRARLRAAGAVPRLGADLRGMSVLVVDDDPAVLDATRGELERFGCRVVTATSAREACAPERLAQVPDAILADYQLDDGLTGVDAIAAIRRLMGTPVPALVVTGATAPDVVGKVRDSGLPVLHKPVTPAKLRAALTQLVRSR